MIQTSEPGHYSSVADLTFLAADSPAFLRQRLEPSARLPAHITGRRPAVAGAAFYRALHREHAQRIRADPLLDCLHGGEWQLVQGNLFRGGPSHDSPAHVVRFAERHAERA